MTVRRIEETLNITKEILASVEKKKSKKTIVCFRSKSAEAVVTLRAAFAFSVARSFGT